jgi:signal transduction histidine kinase
VRLFRIAITVYAIGVVTWLVLGLLPTLAQTIPAFDRALAGVAEGTGPVASVAERILDADTTMAMTPTGQAWLQYGFSVLNLALGLVLAVRRPDQLVPRLLAFALLGTAATFNDPAHRAFHVTGSPWPIAMAHFAFHVISGVCYLWAVVLFPDDAMPGIRWLSRRGRQVAVVAVSTAAVAVCWFSSFLAHPQFFVVFFGVVIPSFGVAAQGIKITAEQQVPAERAASRLLCAALVPALATAVVWMGATVVKALAAPPAAAAAGALAARMQSLFPAVFAVVPVVLCAVIVKYRLWDIDRILGRVLVYGFLVGVVAVGYGAALVLGGWLAGGTLWWTVAIMAVVVAAVDPLRRRATRWANQLVYGQVLSPTEAMRDLMAGLEQLSPAGGIEQVVDVVVRSTRASGAAVWVATDSSWTRVTGTASTASTATDRTRTEDDDDDLATLLGGTAVWPIEYHGERLASLVVQVPDDIQLTATDVGLIGDVAGHAGLLVHNALLGVRLVQEIQRLDALAAELRTARRTLVAAQDRRRQQIERDLHDGAQQAIVAAVIETAIARSGSAPSGSTLDEVRRLTGLAETMLEELTTDGRPAILAGEGLGGALTAVAGIVHRGGVQVDLDIDAHRPVTCDPDVWAQAELTAWFCCSEALQNVAKYAGATTVSVTVGVGDDELQFTVADDGRGFDPDRTDTAGGLEHLRGRCTAVGGFLVVESVPGRGTRLRGSLPLTGAMSGIGASP